MRVISRRGRQVTKPEVQIIVEEARSYGVIITDLSVASDEDIERARRVLEDIRRQLEEAGACNLTRAVHAWQLS